ncbi:unnamed protein product [marine sediment metagenome]|uniref:Uncharacterized protein n=1 Tax=marine sediment metagenome TaxID=412755 RepID=X1KZM3_9ZZZZ
MGKGSRERDGRRDDPPLEVVVVVVLEAVEEVIICRIPRLYV